MLCLCYPPACHRPGSPSHCSSSQQTFSALPQKPHLRAAVLSLDAMGTRWFPPDAPQSIRWPTPEEHFQQLHFIQGSRDNGHELSQWPQVPLFWSEGGHCPQMAAAGTLCTKAVASWGLLQRLPSAVVYLGKRRAGCGPGELGFLQQVWGGDVHLPCCQSSVAPSPGWLREVRETQLCTCLSGSSHQPATSTLGGGVPKYEGCVKVSTFPKPLSQTSLLLTARPIPSQFLTGTQDHRQLRNKIQVCLHDVFMQPTHLLRNTSPLYRPSEEPHCGKSTRGSLPGLTPRFQGHSGPQRWAQRS